MRMVREQYQRTRYWPAATNFYAEGYVMDKGKRYRVTGVGTTPTKARLDLLFQQGRRRFPPAWN